MPLGGNDTPCLCGPLHACGALWASPLRVRFAPSSRLGASHPSEVLPGCVQPGVGGAGGCRTRTFAALAQPRAFRRRSFPDELPAPCWCFASSLRARLSGPSSVFPLCHTLEGEFPPSQGGADNRHVDQTRRGGKGWGRPSEPFSAADAKHLPARGHHARSKGMTSTFPQSTGSGRRRVSSHAVSWGSSSSGVFRRTTA